MARKGIAMEPAVTAGKSDVRSLTRRFLPWVVLALIVALAVPAIAKHNPVGGTVAAEGDSGATFTFDPVEIEIVEGTNITFSNNSPNAPHTFSSVDFLFESGAIVPGGKDRVVNTERLAPGKYVFFCGFHPVLMTGELTVVPAPAPPAP